MSTAKKYVQLSAEDIFDLRLALNYLATADKAVNNYSPDPELADRIGRFAALDARLIRAELSLENLNSLLD